jgi:hypothetical protein
MVKFWIASSVCAATAMALGLTLTAGVPASAQQAATPSAPIMVVNPSNPKEVSGIITSASSGSFTLRQTDNTMVTVAYDPISTIMFVPSGPLTAGQQVVVGGTGSGTSFTARKIWAPDAESGVGPETWKNR